MTGLEKMKSQILNEAELSAKKILDEAKQDAEKVMQTAKENAEAECGRISKKSEAELEAVKERAASSRDLQKRKAILQAKQEVIAKILDDVYEALLVLDDKSYFEFIRKMLKKFVLPQEGSICFSSNDLKRMPENFESEIRHQITADITAANKDELLGLQQEFESKRQELSEMILSAAVLFFYMEESKKTVPLRQCSIPRKVNFPIKFMYYYFHKR